MTYALISDLGTVHLNAVHLNTVVPNGNFREIFSKKEIRENFNNNMFIYVTK
jgi:hypothetical protein